ncbi:hypothetical protein LJ707_01280 [Mucilaginibacter sp. UR6-1]|uniref:hypothetical protein n=1 Tax=Mucilaginibacter sp. UR6-1 TaxID=1435643 RepID=UPI001E4D8B8C|nr:hypothetical protein [Mucilaginibacter sp. UR6-1]MCC8407543.1 hypothetical protein [Mucilaginibacter sp. UR6-1]
MKPLFKPIAIAMACLGLSAPTAHAQNEADALMMGKHNLCIAAGYSYSSWDRYWEGSLKRDNANIGTFSASSIMAMLNYGIRDDLNIMVSLPYVSTKTSAGTLSGLNGLQDLSFYVKYRPVRKTFGSSQKLSVFAVAGYSAPSHNYNVDLMPVSIGMGSNVTTGRLIVDYQLSKFFATASGSYLYRSNVEIDRTAYYTTRQINSNQVQMPNAGVYQFRTGYRTPYIIAEAYVDHMRTYGGFDIRRNDMPFVSNTMNSTNVGFEGKYYLPQLRALGLHAAAWRTLEGRNVGQATGFMAGVLYTLNVAKSK